MEEIVESLVNVLIGLVRGSILILIMITVPVWILPYFVWKSRKKNDLSDPDDYDYYMKLTR